MLGIFSRRERWGLTFRGKCVLVVLTIAVGLVCIRYAHDFLAPTNRVQANILIIEGWAPPWAMIETAEEYRRANYQHLMVVRPVLDRSSDYDITWDATEYGVAALVKNGVPPERITKILTVSVRRDRTYHCAISARDWLLTNKVSITGINVATVGPHARRSGLLYRKVFSDVPVGTIALQPRSYDHRRWWRYSEGVREVIGEVIAYFYARFLFNE